jgi:hypothetical protein
MNNDTRASQSEASTGHRSARFLLMLLACVGKTPAVNGYGLATIITESLE